MKYIHVRSPYGMHCTMKPKKLQQNKMKFFLDDTKQLENKRTKKSLVKLFCCVVSLLWNIVHINFEHIVIILLFFFSFLLLLCFFICVDFSLVTERIENRSYVPHGGIQFIVPEPYSMHYTHTHSIFNSHEFSRWIGNCFYSVYSLRFGFCFHFYLLLFVHRWQRMHSENACFRKCDSTALTSLVFLSFFLCENLRNPSNIYYEPFLLNAFIDGKLLLYLMMMMMMICAWTFCICFV